MNTETIPALNKPLLAKTINHILKNPETWDQTYWHSSCGTTACFAGHAQIFSGNRADADTAKRDATLALGLTDYEADYLFGGNRSLYEIYHKVSDLISEDSYDRAGYDRAGYDRAGYDQAGYSRDGYDRDGYNRNGYDRDGYDRNGYNRAGYNRAGCDPNGYDRDGYDRDGYDRDGYDRNGYGRNGYDRNGYDRDGEKFPLPLIQIDEA